MPKVSVILPTYNHGCFLGEAIQSVLDQTFTDFEVIVVDAGSTDNTREVVESFRDTRIRYIYQENRGVCAARNIGIEASSSEYIAFLDTDDVLLEEALEKWVQVLDRHPEVAFSYSQAYMMDERGGVYGLRKQQHKYSHVYEGSEEIGVYLVYGYQPTAVMARRRCLYEVGLFNPAFHSPEDFDMMVRLAKKNAVAYIAEPLHKYRKHSSSRTSARDLDEIENSHSRIFEDIFNDAELGPVLSSLRPRAYFHLYSVLASVAYGKRWMKTARAYLFKALKIHPRGFFKSLWLPWIFLFAKACLPLPVLGLARGTKRYLSMGHSAHIPPSPNY